MTHDGRKGLDISYNCLNLPSYAETADGSSLTYTYLADGTKVSAVSGCGYGLKYRGSFVYETGDFMDDCLQSIAWDEGRIMLVAPAVDTLVAIEPELPEIDMPGEEVADSALVDIAAGMLRDLFFVTDHLGNVRSVVDVSPDLVDPVILEQNDYLPFGTKVQNSSYASITENRYRYAGKEEQNIGGINLSLLDFGARYYDPYVARWTSVDPMAWMYSNNSMYSYCINNPLLYSDPNGSYTMVKQNEDGTYVVIGGVLDDDLNIYEYFKDGNGEYTIRGNSIGYTATNSSFYSYDNEEWIGAIIDPKDMSGDNFLKELKNGVSLISYMIKGLNGNIYDFKVTNNEKKDRYIYYDLDSENKLKYAYRGSPIGVLDGRTIYASARDIGNIGAGIVASMHRIPYQASRVAFDLLQTFSSFLDGKFRYTQESTSSVNAQKYGYYYIGYPSIVSK